MLRYGREPASTWLAIALTLLGIAAAVVLARRPQLPLRRLRDAEGTLDEPVSRVLPCLAPSVPSPAA